MTRWAATCPWLHSVAESAHHSKTEADWNPDQCLHLGQLMLALEACLSALLAARYLTPGLCGQLQCTVVSNCWAA